MGAVQDGGEGVNEHCGNCANCYKLEKLDFSQGGCIHTEMEGYICMAFADEGLACWMVGEDLDSGRCECWTEKKAWQKEQEWQKKQEAR